jgi:PAS domain S-box-containing protein
MNSEAILANAASFVLTAILAVSVISRRGKSPLHWTLLAMLLGIVTWAGAAVWRHAADTRPDLVMAFRLMFLGVAVVPPAWLLLAARYARVRWVERQPSVTIGVILIAALLYGVVLTNEWHGRFAGMELDGFEYRPLFWVSAAWSWACVVGGIALFLRCAGNLARRRERAQAFVLVVAALLPLAANITYLGELLPWAYDPTAVALGVSGALLFPLIFRFELFGRLPLLRRDVIEHLRDGVVVADSRGVILDANPAAERLLGEPTASLRGQAIRQRVITLATSADRWAAELALRDPDPDSSHAAPEITTIDKRRVRISASVVTGGDGSPAGEFVVLNDCTDERRNERALRQAQKLESVGFLAAGIAHEVNNPLAFVRSNLSHLQKATERLKDLVAGAPLEVREELLEMPQIVEETADGIERIARTVASLRRLSRDAGEEDAAVDLHDVVRESAKLAELARGFGSARLEMTLAPSLPAVRGSREALVQVFLNLLLNAKQALADRPEGRIRVTTRAGDAGVEVAIEDDGRGIAADVLERIFDPFFTTKGPDEGTGLGLPIAYDIVREHRGAIEVESLPGQGAIFTVRIPRAAGDR